MPPSPPNAPSLPQTALFRQWLLHHRGWSGEDDTALWHWARREPSAFWQSLWDHWAVPSPTPPQQGCFAGVQVNVAQQVFRHVAPAEAAGQLAIVSEDERGRGRRLSWGELRQQVASLALALKGLGVQPGQRIAASLPNGPEAVVAWLACASLGAIWLRCGSELDPDTTLARLQAFEPHLLIAADGVYHGGQPLDRSAPAAQWRAALPTARQLIVLRTPYATERLQGTLDFDTLTARDNAATAAFEPVWLPFDHPLWAVPGPDGSTTLQSHGHALLAMRAQLALALDLGGSHAPTHPGERWHVEAAGNEALWPWQVSGLLNGTTLVLFDGHPSGPTEDADWTRLWRLVARHRVTVWGAHTAHLQASKQAGLSGAALHAQGYSLDRLRVVATLGPPPSTALQDWCRAQCKALGVADVKWRACLGDGAQNPEKGGGMMDPIPEPFTRPPP